MSTTVEVVTERVDELIANEETKFKSKRRRSDQMWKEAREFISRGVPSSFQDAPPQPLFVKSGKGSRILDVDDNEYVDFHNGFGVMVVGHAHPLIVEALSERIRAGTHFAQPVDDAREVAKNLAYRFKQPQWRFSNSGTEATLDAVRLARGFTGRDRIVKIEGSYHGHHDSVFVSVEPKIDRIGPADDPIPVPYTGGIPRATSDLTSVISYNNIAHVERAFARYPGEVAAIIVEPVLMNIGIVPPDDGYLEHLKEVCHRNGALLIFDEVKTGCTLAPGGASERYGVTPDLIALAKAIGGGVPCGAIGGRADLMGQIDDGRVAQFGTFNGNPLTMAASLTTLTRILTPTAYAHFDALSEVLSGGLAQVIAEYDLPFHVIAMGARGCITYRRERVRNYRDYLTIDRRWAYVSWLYQCNRGVLMAPYAEENWTLSVQHSEEDVQRYVDNFAELARDLTN
jgi:glutamate-1-semialdehyde 2,1-aminomutase